MDPPIRGMLFYKEKEASLMKQEIMLTGKVALITGGGTGLGLAIAREMAEMGAEVVLAGRRLEVHRLPLVLF